MHETWIRTFEVVGWRSKHLLPLLLLLPILAGCPPHPKPDSGSTAGVGAGLAGLTADVDNANRSIDAARPHSDTTGKEHLKTASQALADAKLKAAEAGAANDAVRGEAQSMRDARLALEAEKELHHNDVLGPWTHRWLHRLKWIIGLAVVAAIALRGMGLLWTGWAGTICSIMGTGIIGILTGGVSLVDSFFTNLWFRVRSPSAPLAVATGATGAEGPVTEKVIVKTPGTESDDPDPQKVSRERVESP